MVMEAKEDGASPQSPIDRSQQLGAIRPVFAAVAAALAAAGSNCECQACKILKSAAPELASFIYPMPDAGAKPA